MRNIFHYTVLCIIGILLFWGCENNSPHVCIVKASGQSERISVEIARTPAQKQLGLMYRTKLPGKHGMLFISDNDIMQTFTMKNTLIPLDMIFIGSDKRIVGWVENTKPLTEGPYAIQKPSQYVLEVNAFFCKESGIAVGDTVLFKNIDLKTF